ncbi:replication initiation protein [Aliarcobacter butzleri]|uniref:replication initiation protein n=1 Tax=Aliarcobacter butzleri TaxID=28197 RepID=UPI00263CE05E|nr:replication initiation protein [Aliarcobacter butzleri]MDN5100325.1 replication initiation protein [Aliarcobacter butzleri]
MDYESSLNLSNDIRISHEINEATFNLSAMSLDLLCMILAQIKKEDNEFKFYKLGVSTIEKRINRKLNRDSFKKSIQELESATLDILGESIKWFEILNFESSNGILEIKLNEQLKPYLLNLESRFVLAQLDSILNLNGYYSKRFYLLLAQYKKMQKCKYDLIKLHKILSTPNSLQKLYSNFKSRVLDFSMGEINQNTELKVEYEENKIGKSVNSLDFRIRKIDKPKIELVVNAVNEVKHNKGISAVEDWLKNN